MELLLALVIVAVVLVLARNGFLHPGDYLMAAGLATLLAVCMLIVLPDPRKTHELATLGAPHTAYERMDFLLTRGVKVVIGSLLVAVASVVAARMRRRLTPERYA